MNTHHWHLNEKEYYETDCASLLLFHDLYPIGRQGGLELIMHDSRILTNGDVRILTSTSQWDEMPEIGERQIKENGTVTLENHFIDLEYTIRILPDEERIRFVVDLKEPLPTEYVEKAAFQFAIFPAAYWGKTFHFDSQSGIFPRQANGPVKIDDQGEIELIPLGSGKSFSAAPEDPAHFFIVSRNDGGILSLYDGRMTGQHHWFILRGELKPGTTKGAAEIILWANQIPGWIRKPAILHSQVGYHPTQEKKILIELDQRASKTPEAELLKIDQTGSSEVILTESPQSWGNFLRYHYKLFDVSAIREEGMYQIRFGNQLSSPFPISKAVYKKDVWQPTLETFFPVQMCHMHVRDRYRVWHGVCHLDDAIQAPTNHVHFDGYKQGPQTCTDFKPGEHIPYLNVGGWHDAGDFDLASGSQAATTYNLALAREAFGINSDQTSVDWESRMVYLHKPDGRPDIVEQVRHGVENLLGGYRTSGHSFSGIIAGDLMQYVHQGEGNSMTDNHIYDPSLSELEVEGNRSGKNDDRWAFTNYDSATEYKVATSLAAASRVLRRWFDDLAEECLQTALAIWTIENSKDPTVFISAYAARNAPLQSVLTAVELYIATGEERFLQHIIDHIVLIEEHANELAWAITRVLTEIEDDQFQTRFNQLIQQLRSQVAEQIDNPFGVAFPWQIWGVTWQLQTMGVKLYYLHKTYPALFEAELLYRIVHYVLGTHPGSSTSLVSGVGVRSMTTAFGTNRADFSYIPGGGGSGPNLIRPDFPELKEGYPHIWQQAEYVMGGASTYLFCVLAVDDLLTHD